MISIYTWLPQVVELFNDILLALMEEPVFFFFLGVLVFLIIAGSFSWLAYLGRKGKL